MKFGGEYRRFYNNNFNLDTGLFRFGRADDPASAQKLDFLNGNANSFSITLGDRSSSIETGALGFYVQDNFKVLPNLTFELGLRYDWNMTPTERYDRFVVFDPATASLVQVGSGIDRIYKQNNKNFQPRFGFAWDPFKDGKTSVRAAYAILTDQPVTNMVTPLSFQSAAGHAARIHRPDQVRQRGDGSARSAGWRPIPSIRTSTMLTSSRGTSIFSVS